MRGEIMMQKDYRAGVAVESLEARSLLSVSVAFADGTLRVVGDSSAQRVQITDAHAGNETTTRLAIDRNRNGSYTDAADFRRSYRGVTRFVLDLRGGNDLVTVTLTAPYSQVSKSFRVLGGTGADRFSFTSSPSVGLRNAALNLNLDMGSSRDRVDLHLDDIAGSTVTGSVVMGTGNDRVLVSSDYDVRSSRVTLGVNLGGGNDSYLESHDREGFDLLGSSSLWQTSVRGGEGDDSITSEIFGDGSATLEGRFRHVFSGEGGNDVIRVLAPAAASGSLSGGTGRDRIDAPSSFTISA
jgi:hypothetical protein